MHWRELLLLFGLLWAAQVIGTALQMRHYRRTFARLAEAWNDGFIGAGNARSRFGRGAIVIVAVSPDDRVRRVLVMEGRTVWAKFREVALPPDRTLASLGQAAPFVGARAALAGAVRSAIAQIDAARARHPGHDIAATT